MVVADIEELNTRNRCEGDQIYFEIFWLTSEDLLTSLGVNVEAVL